MKKDTINPRISGDYHGHMEHTAGHLTKGEYKVALPDGRIQVVSYEAVGKYNYE